MEFIFEILIFQFSYLNEATNIDFLRLIVYYLYDGNLFENFMNS